MKRIMFLTHDYWHHSDTLRPLADLLFGDCDLVFTEDPNKLFDGEFDLFVSFKDPVENDRIPTPVWCDEKWTREFLAKVNGGMGAIIAHAALTDLPSDHPLIENVIKSMFITHPEQCEVTFRPESGKENHPLLDGVGEFVFPAPDEHYVMNMTSDPTEILARTYSVNGVQPAAWVHSLGKGRIFCAAPGHCTENLTFPPFVRLLKNAADYCAAI